MRWAVVIEKTSSNCGAYVPDLPGRGSVGDTIEETKCNIVEAIELHLEGMREDGDPLPKLTTVVDYVEIGVKEPSTQQS